MDTEAPKPLGNMSVLHRELRDEIYVYLIPMGYTTQWDNLVRPEARYRLLTRKAPGLDCI